MRPRVVSHLNAKGTQLAMGGNLLSPNFVQRDKLTHFFMLFSFEAVAHNLLSVARGVAVDTLDRDGA